MNKQSLQQNQRQSLSSRQIFQIKLLELPLSKLEERIKEELIVNPALEQVREEHDEPSKEEELKSAEETIADDYLTEDDIPDYKLKILQDQREEMGEIPLQSDSKSLQQYLTEQLNMLNLEKKEQLIAEQIIGNLSEDGYLRASTREIEDYLLFNENLSCSKEELEKALQKVQSLDPAGVAARDLQESLLIQLRRLPESKERELALKVTKDYFEDLGNRRYEQICSKLKLTTEEFKAVQHTITSLNPKPGNGFGSDFSAMASRITPDFIVRLSEDGFRIWLNEEGRIPQLRVNPGFLQLSEEKIEENKEKKEEQSYAKQQVSQAKWFIEAIEMRRNTLLRCMEVIVSLQADFFRSGDVHDIKPMILQDVAERTGHDVSTISRISNEKFVECDYGIYALKFFFNEGGQKEDGNEISSLSIKALLQEIVDGENKKKPLTDEKIAQIMTEKGVAIARRTLAKYREQLGILPARLRRKL